MSAVRTSDEKAPNHNISKAIEPFQSHTLSLESRPTEQPSNCDTVIGRSLQSPSVVHILRENQSSTGQSFHSTSTPFGSSSEFNQGQRKAASPSAKHISNTMHKTSQIVRCENNTLDDDNSTNQAPFAMFPGSTSYRRIPSVTDEDKLGNSYPEPQYCGSGSKENSSESTKVPSLLDTTSKHWEMRPTAHHDEYNEKGDDYYLTKSDYDGDDDEDDQTAALLK